MAIDREGEEGADPEQEDSWLEQSVPRSIPVASAAQDSAEADDADEFDEEDFDDEFDDDFEEELEDDYAFSEGPDDVGEGNDNVEINESFDDDEEESEAPEFEEEE